MFRADACDGCSCGGSEFSTVVVVIFSRCSFRTCFGHVLTWRSDFTWSIACDLFRQSHPEFVAVRGRPLKGVAYGPSERLFCVRSHFSRSCLISDSLDSDLFQSTLAWLGLRTSAHVKCFTSICSDNPSFGPSPLKGRSMAPRMWCPLYSEHRSQRGCLCFEQTRAMFVHGGLVQLS
jgi:hypothetical protein